MSLANAAHSVVEPSVGTRRFAGSPPLANAPRPAARSSMRCLAPAGRRIGWALRGGTAIEMVDSAEIAERDFQSVYAADAVPADVPRHTLTTDGPTLWIAKALCEWSEEEKVMPMEEWLALEKGLI